MFWGARKLLETMARRQPLLLALEDIHWGETTFLEFVEYLAEEVEQAPILVVCLARPELLETNDDWGARVVERRILLEPLSEQDVGRVIDSVLEQAYVADEVSARIASAAEGNPLFVEQLVEMMIDEGLLRREGDAWVAEGDLSSVSMPPTIHALLAARLEKLSTRERAVIDAACVAGQVFAEEAVAAAPRRRRR